MSHRFSRRALLDAAGVSAAFVPLLSATRRASGAAPVGPKRLVIIQWTNGVLPDRFYPTGTEAQFTLPECLTPLEPHRSDVIVMGGLDLTVCLDDPLGHHGIAGHQSLPHLLTGAFSAKTNTGGEVEQDKIKGNAISIDQHVARAIMGRQPLPLKSLELGVLTTGSIFGSEPTEAYVSFNGPTTNKTWPDGNKPDESPASVYKRLFEGRALGGEAIDKLRRERKSVLDVVGRNLTTFAQRLGTEDRQQIEQHLGSIRTVEKELDALSGGGACAATPPAADLSPKDKSKFAELATLQIELMIMALRCDVTRVVTFMLPNGSGSTVSLPFLGGSFTQKAQERNLSHETGAISHHEIAHNGGSMKAAADRWFVSVFADVIKRFKATPDPAGGTLFDGSVLLFANHMGVGAAHSVTNVPFIIAGSGRGYFKTGRWLKFTKTPHNGLLTSLARAMDVPTDRFGDPKYDTTVTIDARLRG